jgi:hypothetical protein
MSNGLGIMAGVRGEGRIRCGVWELKNIIISEHKGQFGSKKRLML